MRNEVTKQTIQHLPAWRWPEPVLAFYVLAQISDRGFTKKGENQKYAWLDPQTGVPQHCSMPNSDGKSMVGMNESAVAYSCTSREYTRGGWLAGWEEMSYLHRTIDFSRSIRAVNIFLVTALPWIVH